MTLDLSRSPHQVAPDLIGAQLYVDNVGGVIVEVEAYDHEDPAAHGFGNRRTERNGAMFLGGGHVYVYRSYGIHWCMNIVCGEPGVAGAVLIRALKPTRNVHTMRERRGVHGIRDLCSGPGKLCQALGVTKEHDGLRVDGPPFILVPKAGEFEIASGARIGITKNPDVPWRYGWKGSRYLSKPFSARR